MSRTARWSRSKPLEKILLFNSPYPSLSLRSFPCPVSLVLVVLSLGVHAPPTGWSPPFSNFQSQRDVQLLTKWLVTYAALHSQHCYKLQRGEQCSM